MTDSTVPPPVIEEPTPIAPPVLHPELEPPAKPKSSLQRIGAGILAAVATFAKYAALLWKLIVSSKFLLTGGTMLASVWFYSLAFGWKFAAGFVLCILVHEMGHVFMAWRMGIPVSAPIFIPGMGALILQKRFGGSAWRNAIVGIGGPLFGALAGVGCYAIYLATDNRLFLGLALTGFLINLFNMIPMFPLDGGWITGAVSPYIWVLGMAALIAMVVFGYLKNPFIYVLIILSIPRVIDGFRRGTMDAPGNRTSPAQKVTMGLAYVGLCAFLAAGVAVSGATSYGPIERPPHVGPSRSDRVVVQSPILLPSRDA
jgi:Zn-dependent protease